MEQNLQVQNSTSKVRVGRMKEVVLSKRERRRILGWDRNWDGTKSIVSKFQLCQLCYCQFTMRVVHNLTIAEDS